MKSIFFCERPETVHHVYPQETIDALKAEAGLISENVFDLNHVKENPAFFADVNCIFSTWGMPVMTEEEISTYFPALKCVFYGAGSVQRFARPFLHCGVRVFSAWGANAIPVAEYTAAQIVLATKGYFALERIMSSRHDAHHAPDLETALREGDSPTMLHTNHGSQNRQNLSLI